MLKCVRTALRFRVPAMYFSFCPPPNISLSDVGISFAIPVGFTATTSPDSSSVAAYEMPEASSTADIIIRQYAITASSTALATIEQTAIAGASDAPVRCDFFFFHHARYASTSRLFQFRRFEGVVDTAYYLAQENDVLRFDAIDNGITNWNDSNLDTTTLPALGTSKTSHDSARKLIK